MKATLTYNLPEDEEDFEGARKAFKFWQVLFDFSQYLRGLLKYGYGSDHDKPADVLDKIQTKFWELCSEHDVSLEEYS